MALVADYRVESVTADGATTTIKEYTVFGGANPLKADTAVALTAYKVDESLVETSMVVTPNTASPYTVTTWDVTNTVDGWVKHYISLIPKWLVGTTYNRYDVVYDVAAYYQYINITSTAGNLTSNATYWVAVPDPTKPIISAYGTSTQSNNLIFQILNIITKYQAQKCYVKLAAKLAKDNCIEEYSPRSPDSVYFTTFTRLDALLNVSYIDEVQQLYLAGEKAMRLAERFCEDCGCGCSTC
jgi:hypothetical protein